MNDSGEELSAIDFDEDESNDEACVFSLRKVDDDSDSDAEDTFRYAVWDFDDDAHALRPSKVVTDPMAFNGNENQLHPPRAPRLRAMNSPRCVELPLSELPDAVDL